MKKFFSTLIIVTTIFTFTAFAGGDQSPVTTCADGHMHLPGYACTPPNNIGAGDQSSSSSDDSILAYIESLIDEYNPFF